MSEEDPPGLLGRLVLIGVLIALISGAAVFDRTSSQRAPHPVSPPADAAQIGAETFAAPTRIQRDRAVPTASRLGDASVTWFCGGAPAKGTTLLLTNRAAQTRTATITAQTTTGPARVRNVDVPAHTTRQVDASFAGTAALGAVVESRKGGLVATERFTGDQGVTTSSCATASSASWYFAGGNTDRGSTERLVLFNPFDELGTADVTFLTPNGFRHPQATQGLAVPGRSVVVVDVGKVQNRRSGLGSVVTTRAGRLVAWRYQTFDGTGPKLAGGSAAKGVSVTLGLSAPLTGFALPAAVIGQGVTPRIIVANPGTSASKVRLSFDPVDSENNASVPSVDLDLAAGEVKVLSNDDLRQIPQGAVFTVTGRVVDGGAVAAELWFDGARPSKGHGAFATVAVPVAATAWVVPVGLGSAPLDQLQIQARGRAASVRIWRIGDGGRVRVTGDGVPTRVAASRATAVDLAAALKGHAGEAVVVEATAPVVVSRMQAGAKDEGLVSLPGVPVVGTLAPG